jgi:hypothetical protein
MLRSILCLCLIAFILTSCVQNNQDDLSVIATSTEESATENKNYIDDIIFLGESTTYHLKSRGVLSDGKDTRQVWAPKSGTLMLDTAVCDCRILYPDTGEEIALEEALKLKKPKLMLLTFGLNGATGFISRGEDYFKFCYQKLIDMIQSASPDTKIIINSCYPVAENMDMSHYTVDAKTLNSYIDAINIWAKELADYNRLIFTSSASVLKDGDGYLSKELQAEDGYHLNSDAYRAILKYLNEELQNHLN